jgi:4'-phosphopantetheinyl transferase EntD
MLLGFHTILPADVAVREDWIVNLPSQLDADERGCCQGSAACRTREFAAGRACARQALASLGAANATVGKGASREPVWPAGFVGSISHTLEYCAAAVASDDRFVALGIDIERCTRFEEGLLRLVCTEKERRWCGGQKEFGGCLLFSAKESAFKALYPLVHFDPGFHALECEVNVERGTFSVVADARENAKLTHWLQGSQGAFCMKKGYVFTALWIARGHQSAQNHETVSRDAA